MLELVIQAVIYIVHTKLRRTSRTLAFSLVEVVLALSIMSFASVTLIGLLATGLSGIHRASVETIQAQIIQAVINDAQVHPYAASYSTNLYFNDEGTRLNSTDPWLYSAAVTNQVAQIPNGVNFSFASSDAQLLKVQVISKVAASSTNSFYLIWPNTGN